MRTFQATYKTYIQFTIPSDVPLLSPDENDKVDFKTPWSWYIHWGTLHYFDESLVEYEIESDFEGEPDYKRPDNVISDDDGD